MSKILISGYYGFANAGDEAMLTAIIESLRQVEKNVELSVLSGNRKTLRLNTRFAVYIASIR